MAYEVYCCAFVCLITMGGAGWQGVVLLIQPPKPTCFQEAKFGYFPKVSHKLAHQPIPRKSHEKKFKKPGNKTINSKRVLQPHTDPFQGNVPKKPGHILGRSREPFSITVCHCVKCLNNMPACKLQRSRFSCGTARYHVSK